MSDFLEEKAREIRARMDELKPLVDEYHRLEGAARALEGAIEAPAARGGSSSSSRRAKASPGGGSGGRGRPKGSGTRGKEAMEIISGRPGITIPEIAEAMGIKQNYLYRVLPDLQKEGLVRKEGRGWHVNQAA